MAVKMIAIILAGTFFGRWLDNEFDLPMSLGTMIFAIASVALAIYVFIRDAFK